MTGGRKLQYVGPLGGEFFFPGALFCKKMVPVGTRTTQSSPGASGWVSCLLALNIVCSLFIWELAAARLESSKVPSGVTLVQLPLHHIRGGLAESNGNTHASTGLIEADDPIDEMALASRTDRPQKDASEQVFKSTHVYRPSSLTTQRRKRQRRYDTTLTLDMGIGCIGRDTYIHEGAVGRAFVPRPVSVGREHSPDMLLERCTPSPGPGEKNANADWPEWKISKMPSDVTLLWPLFRAISLLAGSRDGGTESRECFSLDLLELST